MAFHYVDGMLYADQIDLTEIAAQAGTPCYLYSRDSMLSNWSRLRKAFPDAEIHYSLKANANLALVRLLIEAGASLDAVSGGEVFRGLRAGALPKQIVFAGVGKTRQEIAYALEVGVGWLNVESSQELARIAEIAQAIGQQPRVALRINPDIRADTHHYIATGHSAAKFGIVLEEARRLLSEFAHSPAVSIEGLHVHIGSQLGSVARSVEAINAVLPLFDAFPHLGYLNVGGGFPVSYMAEAVPPVEEFAAALDQCLRGRSLRLLLEPGRYVVADAGILLVEVQNTKPTSDGVIVVTDGGMTELIRPALYGAVHNVLPVRQHSDHEQVKSQIVGPVCESADVLRSDVLLPSLEPGDLLAISHVGAYGAVMGSTYNARPRPPEILVEGSTWHTVRRRETWQDLVALEV
jgi:diaminopimelate decarboxylase